MHNTVGAQVDTHQVGTLEQTKRIACEAAASGEVLELVDVAGEEQARSAMARARDAQRSWAKLALEERCERILVLRDMLVDRADDLVDVIAKECGKPRQEALVHEVMMTVDLAAFYAKRATRILAPREIELHLFKHRKSYVHYAAVGVVGIVSPANYPFVVPAESAICGLIAGNAVLIKPSEQGTLTALKLKQVFEMAGLPPDLLQVLPGDESTVRALLDAKPDKVVFTGTQAVGRQVAAMCGERLIPCTLELGGKGPLIVCEDADIERTARAIVFGGFGNGGQICLGVQRVYAHASVYEAVLDRVVRLTRELRQGDPATSAVDVGAVARESQLQQAEAAVKDATHKGASLVAGGARLPGKGRFFAPTVLANCPADTIIMREEVLAPVIAIARVASDEDAIERANDSAYGLIGYVFSRDKLRGRAIADRVRAGTVMVNDVITAYACPEAPYGGVKQSGFGRIHGDEGLREMCEIRHVNFNRVPTFRTEPVWFPYRSSTHRTMKRLMRAFMRSGSPMKKMIDLL